MRPLAALAYATVAGRQALELTYRLPTCLCFVWRPATLAESRVVRSMRDTQYMKPTVVTRRLSMRRMMWAASSSETSLAMPSTTSSVDVVLTGETSLGWSAGTFSVSWSMIAELAWLPLDLEGLVC